MPGCSYCKAAKDVTTTERSGNAEALLPIMILLSEALPNGMLSMLELARACLAVFMQGHDVAASQSSTAYPIERDCERMGYPLAVERMIRWAYRASGAQQSIVSQIEPWVLAPAVQGEHGIAMPCCRATERYRRYANELFERPQGAR